MLFAWPGSKKRRSSFSRLLIAAAVYGFRTLLADRYTITEAETGSDWTTARFDLRRRGAVPGTKSPTVAKVVWNFRSDYGFFASPAVVGNRVYISARIWAPTGIRDRFFVWMPTPAEWCGRTRRRIIGRHFPHQLLPAITWCAVKDCTRRAMPASSAWISGPKKRARCLDLRDQEPRGMHAGCLRWPSLRRGRR